MNSQSDPEIVHKSKIQDIPEPALDFDHWASPIPFWEMGITAAPWQNNLAFLIPLKIQFHVKLERSVGSFHPWSISWWCTTAGPALLEELKIPDSICLKQLQLKFMQHWKFLFWELNVTVVLVWAGIWNVREGNIQVSVARAALPFFSKELGLVWGWNSGSVKAGQSHLWCHKGDIFILRQNTRKLFILW